MKLATIGRMLLYDFPPLFAQWWKQRQLHHPQG